MLAGAVVVTAMTTTVRTNTPYVHVYVLSTGPAQRLLLRAR